jgi:hypothetical protein
MEYGKKKNHHFGDSGTACFLLSFFFFRLSGTNNNNKSCLKGVGKKPMACLVVRHFLILSLCDRWRYTTDGGARFRYHHWKGVMWGVYLYN